MNSVTGPESFQSPVVAGQSRVRFALAAIIFIAFFLVGGALIAPWLYAIVVPIADLLHIKADPFVRYIPRAMPIAGFIGIWFVMRYVGFRSLADIGLPPPRGHGRSFLFAFLAGLLALAMVSGIGLAGGGNQIRENIALWTAIKVMAGLIPGAIAVVLQEEILFRGVIHTLLRRALPWPVAVVASSAFFAIVHFLHRPEFTGAVHWDSGLMLLPSIASGMIDLDHIGPIIISLFLAGMLLAIAYDLTGSLYFSMGLHAGAIVAIKMHLRFTAEIPEAPLWFWGSRNLIDGWVGIGALLVAVILFTLKTNLLRRAVPAGQGNGLGRGLAASSVQTVYAGYVAFLVVMMLLSALVARLTAEPLDPPDGRPNVERLGRHRILDVRQLHRAAQAAGLTTTPRLRGTLDVLERVDARNVSIRGWVAKQDGDGAPSQVVVFIGGNNIATAATRGLRPDVTKALGLSNGAENNVAFNLTFACRSGEQPVVAALSDPRYYVPLRTPACP